MRRAALLVVSLLASSALPSTAIDIAVVESVLPVTTGNVTVDATTLYTTPHNLTPHQVDERDKAGNLVGSFDVASLLSHHGTAGGVNELSYDPVTGHMVIVFGVQVASQQWESWIAEISLDGAQLFSESLLVPVPNGWVGSHFLTVDGLHADANGWWVLMDAWDGVGYGPTELVQLDRFGAEIAANPLVTRSVEDYWGLGAAENDNLMVFANANSNNSFLLEVNTKGKEKGAWVIPGAGKANGGGDVTWDPATSRYYASNRASDEIYVIEPFYPSTVPEPGPLSALALAALAARALRHPVRAH